MSRFKLRSGILVVLMGGVFLSAAIWGLPSLYDSGVAKGDQPLLEVMLRIPVPVLGVSLLLWGMGMLLKAAAGLASGDDSWAA